MAKILVIEDNSNILEEILTWLEIEGYHALGAVNGTIGVQLALQEQPDLILCDIMMPEKDGYRVLLELRAHNFTALTPFIFITAKQEKSDIRHGMELGADDYITKPFGRDEFLAAIRSRLERRERFAEHSQKQLTLLRDNLFRSLPHELRTPLVGILGISELLIQDASILTPQEILDYAEMLKISGQHLYRLIENHLLYVQLDIKYRSAQPTFTANSDTVTNPAEVIRDACSRNPQFTDRQNDLHYDLHRGNIAISPQHFSKVLYEIVDNALKFSPPSSLVTLYSRVEENFYQIKITDQGHGITQDEISKIAPYVQFKRDIYEQRGAGLGLVIATMLAEMYCGRLEITSIPGTKTTIHISLPLA